MSREGLTGHLAVSGEMAPHPYHQLGTSLGSTEGVVDTTGEVHQEAKEDADCLNNNSIRNRLKGTTFSGNLVSKICVSSLNDDKAACSASSNLSSLLPTECRLLILSHQFLSLRSQRHVKEAAKYLHVSCTFSLLPLYNSHLVAKNVTSIKAFLSPSPSQVLCEFGSGDCSYSERIYFQVWKHQDVRLTQKTRIFSG